MLGARGAWRRLLRERGWRPNDDVTFYAGLPVADYIALDVRSEIDIWIVGARNASPESRPWPRGRGIAIHYDGKTCTRYDVDHALMSVASTGPDSAVAVGFHGAVVELTPTSSKVHQLAGEPLLYDVAARDGQVWVAGEDGTALHFDRTWQRIDTKPAKADTLTSVAATTTQVWFVGPSGRYTIDRTVAP